MLGGMAESKLQATLRRSDELDDAVLAALPNPYVQAVRNPRHDASLAASLMSLEHGRAIRLLISAEMITTGIGVQRIQFEALARSMWLLYAASADQIGAATAPMSPKAAKAGEKLPMAAEMVQALRGKAPPGAYEAMAGFKVATLKPLHSYAHAGFHPLKRHMEGYPETLVVQILWNSNALLTMACSMFAALAGSAAAMRAVNEARLAFADCLPVITKQVSNESASGPRRPMI